MLSSRALCFVRWLRISFSKSLIRIKSELIRSGKSSGRAPLTISVSELTITCSRAKNSKASTPTRASTLLTPAPIEDSEINLINPSCPDRFTWVPPQSSLAHSPTLTTRTRSPYFSPKSAIAPISRACACVISTADTSRSSSKR